MKGARAARARSGVLKIMSKDPRPVLCALALGAVPLAAGNVCSAATPVETLKAVVPKARPALVTHEPWDDWEEAHCFTVENHSKGPWFLIPEGGNAPMRVNMEEGPGLDGSLILFPTESADFAFMNLRGAGDREARFALEDDLARVGAQIRFTLKGGALTLELLDLTDRAYRDHDLLVCDAKAGVIKILADAYQ